MLRVVERPDHAQTAQSASSVGHWGFALKNALGEVADFVLGLLSDLLLARPKDGIFLLWERACGLMLSVLIV